LLGPDGQDYGVFIAMLLMQEQAVPVLNLELPEEWMVLRPRLLSLLQPKSKDRCTIGQALATIEGKRRNYTCKIVSVASTYEQGYYQKWL
jgi:hypothetical protein